MITFKAIIVGILVTAGGISYAKSTESGQAENISPILAHPHKSGSLSEFKGTILSVNVSSSSLTLVDTAHKRVEVRVSSQTRVTDVANQPLAWSSLGKGDPVLVFFDPKRQVAIQIDRQATTAESVLGIDHPVTK